jgi:hypothetical protein
MSTLPNQARGDPGMFATRTLAENVQHGARKSPDRQRVPAVRYHPMDGTRKQQRAPTG